MLMQVELVDASADRTHGPKPAGVRVTVPVGAEPVPWLVSVTVTVHDNVPPTTTVGSQLILVLEDRALNEENFQVSL